MFTTEINQKHSVDKVLINIIGFYKIHVDDMTVISAQTFMDIILS